MALVALGWAFHPGSGRQPERRRTEGEGGDNRAHLAGRGVHEHSQDLGHVQLHGVEVCLAKAWRGWCHDHARFVLPFSVPSCGPKPRRVAVGGGQAWPAVERSAAAGPSVA